MKTLKKVFKVGVAHQEQLKEERQSTFYVDYENQHFNVQNTTKEEFTEQSGQIDTAPNADISLEPVQVVIKDKNIIDLTIKESTKYPPSESSTKIKSTFLKVKRFSQTKNRKITEKTEEEVKFEEYIREIERVFLLKHFWKKIAWVLGCSIVVSNVAVVLVEGLNNVKSREWLAITCLSLAIIFFFFQPIKMLLITGVTTYVFEFNKELAYKQMESRLFVNPFDETRCKMVKLMRQERRSFYTVESYKILRWKKIKLRNTLEVWNLVQDIISLIVFMIVLYAMVFGNCSDKAYFSTRTVRNLVVTADYTNSIPLTKVRTYAQFMEYINKTLIPALLTNSSGQEKPTPPEGSKDGFIYTKIMDRGWTRDNNIKLLSPPQLRQIRVSSTSCRVHPSTQILVSICRSELSLFNHDQNNYGVAWEPLLPGELDEDYRYLRFWRYKYSWETNSLWSGRLNQFMPYGGGGYWLPLGKSSSNAWLTLNYMNYFNWIDSRTRMVFIDFTTYSPNANLYNVVTIMFEISASGVFIPSCKVYTDQLLYQTIISYRVALIIFTVFTLITLSFAVKEIITMRRVGPQEYFSEAWTLINFLLIIFGIVSIVSTATSFLYLLEKLEATSSNDAINFQFVALWGQTRKCINAFTVSLATIKLFHLLTFLVVFQQWERVIREALRPLIALLLTVLSAVFSFSVFFHLINGMYQEQFNTLLFTIPTMLAHTTRRHDSYDPTFLNFTPPYIGVLFFAVFLGYVSCIMVSTFTAVLLVHLKSVCAQPVRSHLQLVKFLKSLVLKKPVQVPWVPPELQPVTLRQRPQIIPLPYIDEVRLQGMKRITLQLLTDRNYTEDVALNIVEIVRTNNQERPGTDKYNIAFVDTKNEVVSETRVRRMKIEADRIVKVRNRL